MANDLFTFILVVVGRKQDVQWLLSEFLRRIAQIRSNAVVMNQYIPACFEQLMPSELDDIITAAWLMTARAPIDRQCLLELDVLGAALGLSGGQTRLALHVRDALKDLGLANPWEEYDC